MASFALPCLCLCLALPRNFVPLPCLCLDCDVLPSLLPVPLPLPCLCSDCHETICIFQSSMPGRCAAGQACTANCRRCNKGRCSGQRSKNLLCDTAHAEGKFLSALQHNLKKLIATCCLVHEKSGQASVLCTVCLRRSDSSRIPLRMRVVKNVFY